MTVIIDEVGSDQSHFEFVNGFESWWGDFYPDRGELDPVPGRRNPRNNE